MPKSAGNKAQPPAAANQETFSNISKIIEHDTRVTTSRFALLRGVTDIILENSPYSRIQDGRATFPTILLL